MIPTSESISPAWLTEQLNRHGVEGTVSGYDEQQIGTGQIGKCVRYALEYSSGTGPASVVAKYPSDDPTSRAKAFKYLRESFNAGEITTGLLYIDKTRKEMHELMGNVDTPLSKLPLDTLHPGKNELKKILSNYA